MSLTQILGKNLDGEGAVSLLNIAAVSLSAAAANDSDAAQLGQVKAYRDALQAQIDSLSADHSRISSVHVDTTSTNLTDALALADSYNAGTNEWTFGATVIGEGDSIILQAASDPAERSWIHVGGGNGDATDFEQLSSDIQALIDAGVVAVTDALRDSVPEAGDTLNKLFTTIVQTQQTMAGVSDKANANEAAIATLTTEVSGKVRAFYMDGTFALNAGLYECSLPNPANFENARITLKEALGGGGTRKVADSSYVETTSDSQILLQTLAPSFDGKEVIVIIEA